MASHRLALSSQMAAPPPSDPPFLYSSILPFSPPCAVSAAELILWQVAVSSTLCYHCRVCLQAPLAIG